MEVEVLRIDSLLLWHFYVNLSEIACQPMSNKDTSQIQQDPELFVSDLKWHQVMLTLPQIKISRFDATVEGHIIHDMVIDSDIVIDEWGALPRPI